MVLPLGSPGLPVEPTPPEVERLLELAAARALFVVIDTQSQLDPSTIAILQRADRVLLVVPPETAAMRHTQAFLRFCVEHHMSDRVRLVVNRYQSDAGLAADRVEAELGGPVAGRLESQGELVLEAVNSGQPFVQTAPHQPLSESMYALARALASGTD